MKKSGIMKKCSPIINLTCVCSGQTCFLQRSLRRLQYRVTFNSQLGIIPAGLFFYRKGDKQHEKRRDYYDK